MKKSLIALLSFAMVAGLASCQKETDETPVAGNVTLILGMSDTKVTYTETGDGKLRPAWEVGDVVVGQIKDGSTSFSLTVTAVSGGSATVTGNAPKDAEVCLLYKKGLSSIGSQPVTVSYDNQSGDKAMPAVMLSGGEIKDGKGNFRFSGAGAVIGIDNAKGASVGTTITGVTVIGENLSEGEVKNEGGVFTLTAKTKQWDIISTGTLSGITVTDNDGKLSRPIFIAVPVGAKVAKVTLSANGGDSYFTYKLSSEREVSANSYLYVKEQQTFAKAPDGALPGKFSVSATQQVYFSKGNLQAKYNASAQIYTWSFANNQYDYIGAEPGNTSVQYYGNNTDGAVVDLFGWSTPLGSGIIGTYIYYGISSSTYASDYYGDFQDWGIAYCASKGITPTTTWRTLSTATILSEGEWSYLLEGRNMTGGAPRYTNMSDGVDVGGKTYHGLFIYPDNYNGPEIGNGGPNTWAKINAEGIVFLPLAGRREGNEVDFSDIFGTSFGVYWTSTMVAGGILSTGCYCVEISSPDPEKGYGVYPYETNSRYFGYSVRLVSDVK